MNPRKKPNRKKHITYKRNTTEQQKHCTISKMAKLNPFKYGKKYHRDTQTKSWKRGETNKPNHKTSPNQLITQSKENWETSPSKNQYDLRYFGWVTWSFSSCCSCKCINYEPKVASHIRREEDVSNLVLIIMSLAFFCFIILNNYNCPCNKVYGILKQISRVVVVFC